MTSTIISVFISSMLLFGSCGKSGNNKPTPPPTPDPPTASDVAVYVTSANKSLLFKNEFVDFNKQANMSPNTIKLSPDIKYQQMDGFGAALTVSACYNMLKMSQADRTAFLKEIFDPTEGMGYSCIRVAIGCSDFNLSNFSWCDEPGLSNFKAHPEDKSYLFPVLKEILAINPDLKILATPWSPPRWVKVNNLIDKKPVTGWTGGRLNPDFYEDYALYLVLWIQEMERQGFKIEFITVQNEPLHDGNSASMYMTWEEQRDFIKKALGPAFKQSDIKTKILVFDHNFNYDNVPGQIDYPLNIYKDPEASKYVDGSAWHAYGGKSSALDKVHAQAPDKNIYFTEISIGAWNYQFEWDLMWNSREICLGTVNRYCKMVLVWNLLLDDENGPFRPGGCYNCYGVVQVKKNDYKTLTRNSQYYTISHMSKVIKPGAYRINTSGYSPNGLHYSGFSNPDNSYSLVAVNDSDETRSITIDDGAHSFSYKIPSKSIASFKWKQ